MEVINQRTYFLDGQPAYKAGEWPGKKSSHWVSSKKILQPIKKDKKDFFESKF